MSSQNDNVVNFFPPLSIEIPNDTALLPIVPLYTGEKTYASYVYHNSKYTGTSAKHARNEYRIYLNSELEGHCFYLSAEDIVIMRKSSPLDDDQYIYYMDVIKDHSSAIYMQLSRAIEEYPIRGGYGMYDGVLDFFEEKVDKYEKGDKLPEIHIDASVTDRVRKSTDKNQNNIFNSATFREFVLSGYENACAVTGILAEGIQGIGIDVVYIMPRERGGSCLPSNGIALADWLSLSFITGEFSLTSDLEIIVHPKSDNGELLKYQGRQIRVPGNTFFRPDPQSVAYHREHIFGSFLSR